MRPRDQLNIHIEDAIQSLVCMSILSTSSALSNFSLVRNLFKKLKYKQKKLEVINLTQ